MSKKVNFIFLAILVTVSALSATSYPELTSEIDKGDTAWMLVSCAFVLLMTPGLSFFYGGMMNKKNVISTMLQSFVALGVISVLWVVIGFSLAFGDSLGGIIGNPFTYLNFKNVGIEPNPNFSSTIPFLLYALFQLKFAIITPALITGSFAGRIRFRSYILFMVLFSLFIYSPLAHMTWHPDGLFRKWGVLDFAGGTVVHMSAGFAALAGALFLGKRKIAIENHFDNNFELEEKLLRSNKEKYIPLINPDKYKNIRFTYVRQKSMKGLGDAISHASHLVNDEPFAIILADDLIISEQSCLQQLT